MANEDRLRDYLKRVTAELQETSERLHQAEAKSREPIAIIGMSCRFPGGVDSPEALANQYYDKTLRGLAGDVQSEGRTAVLFARKHPDVLPTLTLGRFANRSRRARLRLAAIVLLDRLRPDLPSRLVASVQRFERSATPADDAALFARYDRLFDALYWIGAERALRARGVPSLRVAVADVARWLGS